MIAIVCILAVGFVTVTPLVQTANAHGEGHWYVAIVYEWIVENCACCGLTNYWLINSYLTLAFHKDNLPHMNFNVDYEVNTNQCVVCALTGSCASSS